VRVIVFCHSLVSDWNHGNAHFLRGVCSDLLARGHAVAVYEPATAWSLANLVAEHGEQPLQDFARAYPRLHSERYRLETLDLHEVLDDADLVLVHEWNDHALVGRIGLHRQTHGHFRLLFHDTHHRCVTDPRSMAAYDLRHYDGVLAFGSVIRDRYLQLGWAQRAWTWHEAVDTRVFQPLPAEARRGDLVWIGNWGDEERTAELHEYLLEPVRSLALRATVYGVRSSRSTVSRFMSLGVPTSKPFPAFRPSACSKRWHVASRWSAPPGTTAKACSSPARTTWLRRTEARCASAFATCCTSLNSRLNWPGRAAARSCPGTPAPIGSTS
jgi:spore maturation protein CgeB